MKKSRRARRMAEMAARARRIPGLNLVALMDIFTILVFFLLVNSSEVQDLPSAKQVNLPESVVDSKPRETVTVLITANDILLQGRSVAQVGGLLKDDGTVIAPLRDALLQQADRRVIKAAAGEDLGEVMIMGDRAIPFQLLKKVMATCTDAGFGRVSLAVIQRAREGG